MRVSQRRLWPFGAGASVVAAPVLLIGLIALVVTLRKLTGWPSPASDSLVLMGVFVLTLLPIVLAVLDVVIERGGVLTYAGLTLDFSRVTSAGAPGVSIAANIGVPGRAVSDSDTVQILDALRQATRTEVVVIDLEDGHAWWETRLLVLVAGAVRLGFPELIVFTAIDRGISQRYEGWARPRSLLRALLDADTRYRECYETAMAAARQWALIEPAPGVPPPPLPWMTGGFALQHPWIAFDPSGLPNPLAPEQLLAAVLGQRIELVHPPTGITVVRLEQLFRPLLCTDAIDESWPNPRQVETFLDSDADYVGVTRKGHYLRLLPRVTGLSGIVKSLAFPQDSTG